MNPSQKQAIVDQAQADLALSQKVLEDALAIVVDELPPGPTDLRVSDYYYMGGGSVLTINFAVDAPSGSQLVLDYIGTPENAAGPQSWTRLNGSSLTLQNPAGQSIIVRAQCEQFGYLSADKVLAIDVSNDLPASGAAGNT